MRPHTTSRWESAFEGCRGRYLGEDLSAVLDQGLEGAAFAHQEHPPHHLHAANAGLCVESRLSAFFPLPSLSPEGPLGARPSR
jgi:hypothetical protein